MASTPSQGGLELLHAQGDTLGVGVDLDDLDPDRVAHGQHLAGVVDALPAHVGDVQQAVDPAQVHEGAVVGDVLDHAFADLAFLQLTHKFGALFGTGFLEDGPAGDDDVAARAVHLEDGEGLFLAHQRTDVAHRADVDLRARQEGRGATEVNGKAALHTANDGTHDRLIAGVNALKPGPGFFAAGLLAADNRLAHGVLDPLEEDLDRVADGQLRLVFLADAEFLDGDASLGLEAHIDDREVLLDAHDYALDHLAFHEVASTQGLGQEGREVVAGRVQASIISHFVLSSVIVTRKLRALQADGFPESGWS